MSEYTQEQLKNDYNSWLAAPDCHYDYMLANKYATEKANKDNYFANSIGYWELCDVPQKAPDYISVSGSKYWYIDKGVYRQSDHCGNGIASCSWFIKGKQYDTFGLSTGTTETAFICWDDLKPKGNICKHPYKDSYKLFGFRFTI